MSSSEWHLVYDLARDDERVGRIQEASLTRPGYGFPTKPALFGSAEWWGLIEQGVLPEVSVEGSIERVYWGSMGDWAEFTLRHEDAADNWAREGDVRRYVEELGVRIDYVELEAKPDAPFKRRDPISRVVLKIRIGASARRSPGIAPGPGGVGYRLAGGPGTILHYIYVPDSRQPRALERALADMGLTTVIGSSLAGGRDMRVTDRRTDELTERRQQTVSAIACAHDGVYDGFDLIEEGSCRAEGP